MSYVLAAYVLTFLLIGAYVGSVIWRARSAGREEAVRTSRDAGE